MSVTQRVDPSGPLVGELTVPGCKAISHRALLFAALAEGTSRIVGIAPGDDVARTQAAVDALGVGVGRDDEGALVLTSRGVLGLHEPQGPIDCGNSGTSMRMLAGLCAGLPFTTTLTGDEYLVKRPMGRVVEPLQAMGARIEGAEGGTRAPLHIRGGGLVGRHHDLKVASGQVKTALALAGLQARGITEVHEPVSSRDDTELMLGALGAPIVRLDARTFRISAGAPVPFEIDVPGDPSSAAFLAVAACIVPGSDVLLTRVALNATRIGFVHVLRRMGADIHIAVSGDELGEAFGNIHIRASALHGTTISGGEIPTLIDEIPVLAVAAAYADGVTEVHDAAEMRVKETDRIVTTAAVLAALGAGAETTPDGLIVRGRGAGAPPPAGAGFDAQGDHRIAMTAAVAALGASSPSTIAGFESVAVSYPGFLSDLAGLNGGA